MAPNLIFILALGLPIVISSMNLIRFYLTWLAVLAACLVPGFGASKARQPHPHEASYQLQPRHNIIAGIDTVVLGEAYRSFVWSELHQLWHEFGVPVFMEGSPVDVACKTLFQDPHPQSLSIQVNFPPEVAYPASRTGFFYVPYHIQYQSTLPDNQPQRTCVMYHRVRVVAAEVSF